MDIASPGTPLAADIIACHDCDLLLHDQCIEANRTAHCPRCDAVLHISRSNSLQRTLALSLAGLLLFIPAMTLPILSFEVLGQGSSSTMLNGIVTMLAEGYWWMSILVLFCSVLAPLLKMLLLLTLSAGSLFDWSLGLLIRCQKLYRHLDEWGMFDVYMLGIIVSFVKMQAYGLLLPGIGLWCFAALLVIAAASSSVYDSHLVWAKITTRKEGDSAS